MSSQSKSQVTVRNSNNVEYELSNNNPYLSNNQSDALLNHVFHQNLLILQIPNEILNKAIKLEKNKFSIQMICSLDILGSFYYIFINPLIGLIIMSISGLGLLSTVSYHKGSMFCYMCYQYFMSIIRLINLIFLFLYICDIYESPTIRYYVMSKPEFDIIIASFLFPMQCCIAYHVNQFYNLLPTKNEIEQIALTNRYL